MDVNQLCSILEACMSSNQQQRAAAEQTLEQEMRGLAEAVQGSPVKPGSPPPRYELRSHTSAFRSFQFAKGHLVILLGIAVEPTLRPEIRQSAAISFKNLVKKSWSEYKDEQSPILEEDKAAIREHMADSIIRAPAPVRLQLGETFRTIVHADFPGKWPGLVPAIARHLSSQEEARVTGSMLMLRILARKYEFRDLEDAATLNGIVEATFPSVLELVKRLLASAATSPEAADALRLALKSYWSAMYMGVPTSLLQQEHFAGWMTSLHTLITRPVPQEGQPADPAERPASPWWKTQKWAFNIAYRLFSRYGDAKQHAAGSNERRFSEAWQEHCSQQFLEDHMAVAARLTQGDYLSPRVTNLLLQYLTHALGVKSAWKLIRSHVPTMLSTCVFPLLCFDDEDAELWRDDPQEYIRKGYDLIEDMYSAKTSAANFVVELCKQRPKGNLDTFMHFIVQVMTEYQAAAAAGGATERQERRMDGALLTIGSLSDILKKKEPYKDRLEQMLLQFILPAFGARAGHLRAKACWMAGQFAAIDFRDGSGCGPTYNALFSATVKALQDAELPVRVEAVIGLRSLVSAFDEDHLDDIKPHIGSLLDQLFRLMAEVENEDLVFTLETIVEKFGEDIAPFAVGLCQHLTQAFWRLQGSEGGGDSDSDGDEGALAAFGCLRALSTVLESVSGLPELFPALEPVVFPVMQRLVGVEGQDVYEEVMEILSYFTFFSPEISAQVWSLWPQIYQSYNEWAFDYFENILVPVDNFISRGTEVFLSGQNPNYLTQAVHMAEKALSDSETSEGDVLCAPKLLQIILLNCRGRVDPCVPHFVGLALSRLGRAKQRNLRDQLMGVVATALYYNPVLALQSLQQQSQLESFMNAWFQMIFAEQPNGRRRHFRRQLDKKVGALALTSLLILPDDSLPAPLQASAGRLSAGGVKLLADLQKQQEAFAAAGSESEGSSEASGSEGEDEEEEEEEEGDPATAAEDESYMRRLTRESAKLAGIGADSETDDEWTDDEDESTPLDTVDPFVAFSDALKQLQMQNPARFAAATSGFDQAAAAALNGVMENAELIRAKASVIGRR